MTQGWDSERGLVDVIGTREIAEMAGVQIGTVHQWRYNRRYKEFPEPDWMLASGPVWKKYKIERWLKKREENGGGKRGRPRKKRSSQSA